MGKTGGLVTTQKKEVGEQGSRRRREGPRGHQGPAYEGEERASIYAGRNVKHRFGKVPSRVNP